VRALSVVRPRRALAAALAVTAALAIGGCGGDGDEETGSATTSEQTPPQATAPDDSGLAGGAGGTDSRGGGDGAADRDSSSSTGEQGSSVGERSDSTPPPVSGDPVEGAKDAAPGVPTSEHGDDSIATYGTESGSEERAEVAAVVQAFYDARAARDWALACSMLAAKPRAELEQMLKGAGSGAATCAEVMGGLSQQVPTSAFAEEAEIEEVLSLRTDDEYAFLIYTRPDGKIYATAVTQESGWKIVSIGPAEIVA
jgi:hypothetical protein